VTNRFTEFGATRTVVLSRTQKIVAKRMLQSWATIPHVTHNDECDITGLEGRRQSLPPERKVTLLIFLIKAVSRALRAFPQFNASLSDDGNELILKDYVNIGVAVDTPRGLVLPVLRDCDKKSLVVLRDELSALSEKARTAGIAYDQTVGGSFTISSLGGIGGTGFSPIINAPEVAILGVARGRMQPVWQGQAFEPRMLLPLSLSYDHRVINGADAARFMRFLADNLAQGVLDTACDAGS
jgi:pyruvate dehydrogenase E2 component (dihydrolipoyllysine-residue acetyltransferase)